MSSKKTSWGTVANWYDELLEDSVDSYQKNVIMPNLIRVVEPAKGMKILDVACGQGYFSRAFASNGAEVTGCDISPELIEIAQKQEAGKREQKERSPERRTGGGHEERRKKAPLSCCACRQTDFCRV